MAKYNIIKNGLMGSTTSSGTGNKALTTEELFYLVDGNVTVPAVPLTDSDVLYLDIDLGQRIKVNGIFLYTSDDTQLSNINFYYKNYSEDTFYGCTKDSNTTSYTAIIPEPSAPQYVRCTVSGINIELIEFSIFNDDNAVSFGEDGTKSSTWLSDTPAGEEGTPQTIEIYNTSTSSYDSVTAFACVDHTGEKDDFIKISDKEDGTYVGFEDNVVVGYNFQDWKAGEFDNTELTVDGRLQLAYKGSTDQISEGFIGIMPRDNCVYPTAPFGTADGWAYDHVNNIVWVAFYPGTDQSDSAIKLWKYDVSTTVWTFRCDIDYPELRVSSFAFTCDTNYVYFTGYSGVGSDHNYVFKHDLSGALGGVSTVGSTYVDNYHDNRNFIVADFNGNVYQIFGLGSDRIRALTCYNVAASTATTLSIIESRDFANTYHTSFVYSQHDNCLYLASCYDATTGEQKVQQYSISTDRWNSSYFDYGARISTNSAFITMRAHGSSLYFTSPDYGNTLYKYDLLTDIVSERNIHTTPIRENFPHMFVMDPMQGDDDISLLLVGVQDSDIYHLYGYNTGYEQPAGAINIYPAEGTYMSNIIKMDDPHMSSYFKVNNTSEVGVTSVSTDSEIHDGTIEIRSSSTPVTPINEVYWALSDADRVSETYRYVVGTDTFDTAWVLATASMYSGRANAVCRRTGLVASFSHYAYYATYYYIYIYNRAGTLIYSGRDPENDTYDAHFDAEQAVWYYGAGSLVRNLYGSITAKIEVSIYDFASDLTSTDCWYTNRDVNTLNRVLSDGGVGVTISLYNPYGVCSTEDHGCWVLEVGDPTYGNCVKRFDRQGELIKVTTLPTACYRITHDDDGGFYCRSTSDMGNFYHYTAEGIKDLTIEGWPGYDYLKGCRAGFITYNPEARRTTYFGRQGNIIWNEPVPNPWYITTERCPAIFYWDEQSEDMYSSQYGTSLLPVDYDPVWYNTSNLPWVEVVKNGYFLPKTRYHQVKLTLRNFDGASTPYVSNITMAPAIKIEDIPPEESKPMYVRSTIPGHAEFTQFNLKIKVWWSKEGV